MSNSEQNRVAPVVILILLSVMGGAAIWYYGAPSSRFFEEQELNRQKELDEAAATGVPLRLSESTEGQLIHRYITAYQTRNCSEITQCTEWMIQRLQRINEQTQDPAEIEEARAALCEQVLVREAGKERIDVLGIEDHYLIPQASTYKVMGADPGRTDLAKTVKERVWVMFEYSNQNTAPKTEEGEPIRQLRAGVNISTDHRVLKGAVRGNWEIDVNSIRTRW